MSLGDRFPIDPLSEQDWSEVERAVNAELDASPAPEHPVRRTRWPRIALGIGALAAAATILLVFVSWPAEPARLSTTRLEARSEPVRAVVGEVAFRLGARTELVVVDHADAGTIATLERGEASFAVPPRTERAPFVVQAGDVRVEVVGTRFTVSREGTRVEVAVQRGVVRVTHDGSSTLLERGDRWSTEPQDTRAASERGEAAVPAPRPAPSASSRPRPTIERELPPREPSPREAAQDTRALFDRAASLERADPAQAIALYARVASRGDGWAPAALFAQARLEHERGNHERSRRLLRLYLERHPRGLNAEDARRLLAH